mgnify:CR=1 FL=1
MYNLYFNACSFNYKGYLVKIRRSSKYNQDNLSPTIPFLYAQKQIINLEEINSDNNQKANSDKNYNDFKRGK